MKKGIYLAIVTAIMVACSQSPEQKAEELIRESLKKTLYKPETYKPIDTKIDSAFAPYDDPALYEELVKLGEMNSEYLELEKKVKFAKSSMAIWSDPYMSAFSKNQYQEAKDEFDEASAKMEQLKEKAQKEWEIIKACFQRGRKFIGYKAIHNFRADNNAGNTLIGNTVFFMDEHFENITFSMDLEEYDQVQKAISQFQEQIETQE